jgi:copper(I)-binding protein
MSSAAIAEINIEKPSVRAMPPGQPNTAAFMVMKNTADTPVRLVSVSTPASKKAEFHSHTKDEKGVMRMRKEPYVDIAANSSFEFKSGGHHIMLMGLNKPLKSGDIIDMKVTDSRGQSYDFSMPVKSLIKLDHGHHHHHH